MMGNLTKLYISAFYKSNGELSDKLFAGYIGDNWYVLKNGRDFVNEALLHGKRGDLELRNYKNPISPFSFPFSVG